MCESDDKRMVRLRVLRCFFNRRAKQLLSIADNFFAVRRQYMFKPQVEQSGQVIGARFRKLVPAGTDVA